MSKKFVKTAFKKKSSIFVDNRTFNFSSILIERSNYADLKPKFDLEFLCSSKFWKNGKQNRFFS